MPQSPRRSSQQGWTRGESSSDESLSVPAEKSPPAEPSEPADPRQPLRDAAQTTAAEATARLRELRRLFFSITEHLRETAQRQAELNDRTQELAGETSAEERQPKLGPLAQEQQQLEQFASELAKVLAEQAQPADAATSPAGEENGPPTPNSTEPFADAAQWVQQATDSMQSAAAAMEPDGDAFDLSRVRDPQDHALDHLQKALALLTPPDQSQNDQQDNNEQSEDEQQASAPQPSTSQDQQSMSMNQLLQLIRDRDAERWEQKEKRQMTGTLPVNKDW